MELFFKKTLCFVVGRVILVYVACCVSNLVGETSYCFGKFGEYDEEE
jgi:hypothetical protein